MGCQNLGQRINESIYVLRGSVLGFEFWTALDLESNPDCHMFSQGLWASYLTLPSLGFLFHKMAVKVSTSLDYYKD